MTPSTTTTTRPTLEDLAFAYATDKSHDDHKYTDLYSTLFDGMRDTCRNFTEIGVASGQSLQMWHEYFPNAHIYGVEFYPPSLKLARALFAKEPRVSILNIDSTMGRRHCRSLQCAEQHADELQSYGLVEQTICMKK